jgi:hypothetical protein
VITINHYQRPNGVKSPIEYDVPPETEAQVKKLIEAGYEISCEGIPDRAWRGVRMYIQIDNGLTGGDNVLAAIYSNPNDLVRLAQTIDVAHKKLLRLQEKENS